MSDRRIEWYPPTVIAYGDIEVYWWDGGEPNCCAHGFRFDGPVFICGKCHREQEKDALIDAPVAGETEGDM